MHEGRTVLSQLMKHLPMHEFRRCVARYKGNRKVTKFSCYDQFLCMAFAQLAGKESLRDIEICLQAMHKKLYHSGFRGSVHRSTLADANESRDWRIYSDFAHVLIAIARDLYRDESFDFELKDTVYALDATTIDLCLSLFPWAKFRQHKAAVRLHTLLDLRGNIPSFIRITTGKVHEVNILDDLCYEVGALYLIDRGYTDFARLFTIDQEQAFFVIRAKSNFSFNRIQSFDINKSTGLRCDQRITLVSPKSLEEYPNAFRRIKFYDTQNDKYIVFLTNNFALDALTVTQLYKYRWRIEIFFKWIKQHLHIKSFYGTSMNAVKTQIWIAISVYVLVAIVKKRLKLEKSIYTILQILSVSLFEQIHIFEALTDEQHHHLDSSSTNQLILFNL